MKQEANGRQRGSNEEGESGAVMPGRAVGGGGAAARGSAAFTLVLLERQEA